MQAILHNPLFCISLCIVAFQIGIFIQNKTKISLFNPLLIANVIVIIVIEFLNISIDVFKEQTNTINMLLGPATVVLAVPMYRQRKLLKKYIIPILVATGVGAVTSVVSVVGLSKLFRLDEAILGSLMPKSVTTPIAIELSSQFGGVAGITVTAVVITGITGAIIAPNILKICRIKNEIAVGLAIGTSSHALGTSKAIQLGEIEGAMSSIAIGFTGIFTVILSLFL